MVQIFTRSGTKLGRQKAPDIGHILPNPSDGSRVQNVQTGDLTLRLHVSLVVYGTSIQMVRPPEAHYAVRVGHRGRSGGGFVATPYLLMKCFADNDSVPSWAAPTCLRQTLGWVGLPLLTNSHPAVGLGGPQIVPRNAMLQAL